jgi:hypothetical protein
VFVVVWESKCGIGGHQMTLERRKAEYLSRQMSRLRPSDQIHVMPTDEYAAAAVLERRRKGPPKFPHQRALT